MSIDQKILLIVDDDPYLRLLVRTMLKNEGYIIWEAGTIRDALELAQQKPDLILLDIQLAGENGLDLCRKLKADEKLLDIPIILMSALDTDQQTRPNIKDEGDGFLDKPFEFSELQQIVKVFLDPHDFPS
ncbi:MAG: response regulator [Candidatus Hodarchaeales archaeon]|jgi:CheY-like chemotaxis protein